MQNIFLSGVLTVSDKGSVGLREDESGKIVAEMLKAEGFQVIKKDIVPDDRRKISARIIQWIDQDGLSLVITSGGTGLSPYGRHAPGNGRNYRLPDPRHSGGHASGKPSENAPCHDLQGHGGGEGNFPCD